MIHTIRPYRYFGQWVFDDAAKQLVREAFVGGTDTLIDRAVAHIPGADHGFVALFSARPFPGYMLTLERRRATSQTVDGVTVADGGHDYWCPELRRQAWLCSALSKYFPRPPRTLYVKVQSEKGEDRGENHHHHR